jgi:RNA polymerase sigma-70 factor (ECF subfamily)
MAQDRVIDAHRRHRRAARRSVDREQALAAPAIDRSTVELAAQLCDVQPTPAAAAVSRELQRRFEAAIERLDEQDREVVWMRHFEQLSNAEIAQALKLSAPAASMRYLRAMRRLREILADDEAAPSSDGSRS